MLVGRLANRLLCVPILLAGRSEPAAAGAAAAGAEEKSQPAALHEAQPQDRRTLRLQRAEGNKHHRAFSAMSQQRRAELNKAAGYNNKQTAEESKAAKELVEEKLDVPAEQAAAAETLLAVAALAPRKRGRTAAADTEDMEFADASDGEGEGGKPSARKRRRIESSALPQRSLGVRHKRPSSKLL